MRSDQILCACGDLRYRGDMCHICEKCQLGCCSCGEELESLRAALREAKEQLLAGRVVESAMLRDLSERREQLEAANRRIEQQERTLGYYKDQAIEFEKRIHELELLREADKSEIFLLTAEDVKTQAHIRELEEALNGLLQYMGQTAETVDGPINGVSIEEARTSSLRFHAAWLKAVNLLTPPPTKETP